MVKPPARVIRIGLRPVRDETKSFGFDVARTVPAARHLGRQWLTFDNDLLPALLGGTVQMLKSEIPDARESVALDVKPIYAMSCAARFACMRVQRAAQDAVRQNNPREPIPNRFDPQRSSCARAKRGAR